MVNAFSFDCTACGKCCNSPPAMSLPELFRHRDLFIGCIAIGRVPRKRAGERLRVGHAEAVLDEADVAAFDRLADTLLHRSGESFSLITQGYDYPSLSRCPALEDDGRCRIHFDGKPVMCEVVPLDPLVPDTLQHLVLAGRKQSAGYLGTNCIQETSATDTALFVAEGRIHDPAAQDALARRRGALETEREVWGQAVFESLRNALFDSPVALARIPSGGFMTISIVPALLAAANLSERCRQLCLDYIDSQLVLIERSIERALLRRRLDDRPVTQELRGFAAAYTRAKAILATPRANHPDDESRLAAIARTEHYLDSAWG
ncbi:MAG TPA: hypothetical protein VFE79_08490 [Paraburkholderia sp.]|jgi:Fe-S-cluster containining protein|nr:hypothetical protein [Paraburkholderia sp.]